MSQQARLLLILLLSMLCFTSAGVGKTEKDPFQAKRIELQQSHLSEKMALVEEHLVKLVDNVARDYDNMLTILGVAIGAGGLIIGLLAFVGIKGIGSLVDKAITKETEKYSKSLEEENKKLQEKLEQQTQDWLQGVKEEALQKLKEITEIRERASQVEPERKIELSAEEKEQAKNDLVTWKKYLQNIPESKWSLDDWLTLANLQYENEDFKDAIDSFTRVIDFNPKSEKAYFKRAYSHDDVGDNKAAMTDYNKAIELDPDYAMAYNNRGVLYKKLGKYEAALSDYNEAIELKPDYVDPYYNRGNLYKITKKYKKALHDYQNVLKFGEESLSVEREESVQERIKEMEEKIAEEEGDS